MTNEMNSEKKISLNSLKSKANGCTEYIVKV